MPKNRSIVYVAGLLALGACADQDNHDPPQPVTMEAAPEIELEELERRLDQEGPTEELLGLAKLYNERQLTRRGFVYRTSLGHDHELMFLEGQHGSFVVAERIGREASDPYLQTTTESLAGLSPREIYAHYLPDAEMPQELLELEDRLADATLAAPSAELGDAASEEDPGITISDGLDKHAGDGRHFRDDTHNFTSGGSSKGCENPTSTTVSSLCWTDRTGGGFSQMRSTHVRYHFALVSGNTAFRLRQDGALAIERMMFQGEIMRFTSNGPWHCPGLFCSYYGFGSIVHRGEWNGSGKTWHFGALYEDILRRD